MTSVQSPLRDPDSASRTERPRFWRDARYYNIFIQIATVALVGLLIGWLLRNLSNSLNDPDNRIPSGFDFLFQPTNFTISENWGWDSSLPKWRMLLIGLQNTILAAGVGIVLASVLGLIIGIARLSSNWLVQRLSTLYVEIIRNIPPLVVIIFFASAVFIAGPFPVFRDAAELQFPGTDTSWLILSNSRIGIPSFSAERNTTEFWIVAILALLIAVGIWLWRTQVSINTGVPHRRILWSVLFLTGVVVVAFIALGGPYDWAWPARDPEYGRRLVSGFGASAAYLSVTLALALYTASHIAEIVRGSILAVQKGQGEAASALALSSFQRYRFIILPQALRTALPSITNQYLNLTKNTSLALAVGYAELANLTDTSIGNGSPAPQSILMMMAGYLLLSLVISLAANFFNRMLKLKER